MQTHISDLLTLQVTTLYDHVRMSTTEKVAFIGVLHSEDSTSSIVPQINEDTLLASPLFPTLFCPHPVVRFPLSLFVSPECTSGQSECSVTCGQRAGLPCEVMNS